MASRLGNWLASGWAGRKAAKPSPAELGAVGESSQGSTCSPVSVPKEDLLSLFSFCILFYFLKIIVYLFPFYLKSKDTHTHTRAFCEVFCFSSFGMEIIKSADFFDWIGRWEDNPKMEGILQIATSTESPRIHRNLRSSIGLSSNGRIMVSSSSYLKFRWTSGLH